MRVPINMGVKGRVTATLTNTKTGEKQEVKGRSRRLRKITLSSTITWIGL